ncbi:MAG: class SAM-dependent methyltransferase [Myxococcales bacterium]|nr:class SAM-dependent methyltransferase [Myxococcales bacterium]
MRDSGGAEFWSKVAEAREGTHANVFEPVWKATLDLLQVGQGTRFLDAGCGTGMATEIAVKRGARAYGADAAENMIKLAKKRVAEAEFHHCDMESMPFEAGFFDTVMAINSIHFTNQPLFALRELVRTCAAGGHVAIVCLGPRESHNFEAPVKAMLSLVPESRKSEALFVDPFRLSAVGVLEMMFQEAGLVEVKHRFVECPVIYDSLAKACESMRNIALYPATQTVAPQDALDAAVTASLEPYVVADGRVVWKANHRIVMGKKP